jgi:hypothetical protein
VIVMRVRGLPLVSSCATGRRCTCARSAGGLGGRAHAAPRRAARGHPLRLGSLRGGRARPLICSLQWPTINVWNGRCQWQRATPTT